MKHVIVFQWAGSDYTIYERKKEILVKGKKKRAMCTSNCINKIAKA